MVNTILAKRGNHIVAKGGNPAWPKGSKSRGFSSLMEEMDEEAKKQGKKVSKTWEAAMRLKGSLIVNDPKFLL